MARYISTADVVSRQAVLDLIEHYNSDGLGSVFFGYEEGVKFADAVNKLSPVTPQSKTGHWLAKSFHEVYCDNCKFDFDIMTNEFIDKMKYCPNCGARMESEDKE